MSGGQSGQLQPYADAGWAFLPLGHSTDEKWGKVSVSGYKRVLTHEGAVAHIGGGYNVGAMVPEGCAVIDIDRRHLPDGVNMEAALQMVDGTLRCSVSMRRWPRVRTGDNGLHLYVRLDDPEMVPNWPKYIEFLPGPRQIVAAGSIHPGTRQMYQWQGKDILPLTALPVVTVLGEKRKVRTTVSDERLEVTPEELKRLLSNLDPQDFQGYHGEWFSLLCASHHATLGSEDGLQAFLEWSGGDAAYTGQDESIRAQWSGLAERTHTPVTVWTLVHTVRRHGGKDIPERLVRLPDDTRGRIYIELMDELSELNGKYAFVIRGGRGRVLDVRPKRGGSWQFTPVEDWASLMRNRKVMLPEGPKGAMKPRKLSDLWMEWAGRRTHTDIVMDPKAAPGGFGRTFNLWRGLPKLKTAGGLPEDFVTLVDEVLSGGDGKVSEYLWNWMAMAVQMPERPAEVAVVLRGGQGTGKGTFARALLDMVAPHSQHMSSPGQLVGRFTAGLQDCVVLYLDEAFSEGLRGGEGELKRLITEPTLRLEAKFMEAIEVPNRLSVIMSSNKTHVVPVGMDDRRFMVTDVDVEKLGADRQQSGDFFVRLNRRLAAGGLGELRRHLLERDITGWSPRDNIPKTVALMQQKLYSLNLVESWWVDTLSSGLINGRDMTDTEGFTSAELVGAFHSWQSDNRGRARGCACWKRPLS